VLAVIVSVPAFEIAAPLAALPFRIVRRERLTFPPATDSTRQAPRPSRIEAEGPVAAMVMSLAGAS
jgi:hypothetical protein